MIKIVKAQKEDLKQIRQLFIRYNKEIEIVFPKDHLRLLKKLHPENGDNQQLSKNILQVMTDKKKLFLVAKDNDKLIGSIIGWIDPITNVGKFDQLISLNHLRKREILNKLYIEMEKWFKIKKCPYVIVNVVIKNLRKKLYKEFGFDTVLEEMRKII